MAGWGLLAALLGVLTLGSGVMVFKQYADADERHLRELRRDLAEAHAETGRLRAELGYHRRPSYLLPLAADLGLVPQTPADFIAWDALPPRPEPTTPGIGSPVVVALPSGATIGVALRPAPVFVVELQR
ncbi:MAG: hypothetical protein AAFX81_19235 [Pseudomonadota bacterium]